MVKIYKQPFAHEGDAIAIPDASQPDGKMSSADGWTPDYQLPKTDPNYKPVGRQEMNGVFKEVTEALGQVQVQGAASWSAEGAPYPINAQVYHGGKQWLALRANSVEPAEGEDWLAWGDSLRQDLTNPDKGAAMVGFKQEGEGVVGRNLADKAREWVSVKDFGAVGDGSLSDQSAITNAVKHAYENGLDIYWPAGEYVSDANIPNFHDVRHYGVGRLNRNGNIWHISPKWDDVNELHVAQGGTSTNDGLSTGEPLTFSGALAPARLAGKIGKWAHATHSGVWRVRLHGALSVNGQRLYDLPYFARPLEIFGEDVVDGAEPVTVWDGTAASANVAIRCGQGSTVINIHIKNIKFINWVTSAVLLHGNLNAVVENCWADNIGSFAFWYRSGYVRHIRGEISNSYTGIACQYHCSTNIGGVGTGVVFRNMSSSGVAFGRNSAGHVSNCYFEGMGSYCVSAVQSSRLRTISNTFKSFGIAAVNVTTGANWDNGLTEVDTYVGVSADSPAVTTATGGTSSGLNISGGQPHQFFNQWITLPAGTGRQQITDSLKEGYGAPFRIRNFSLYSRNLRIITTIRITHFSNQGALYELSVGVGEAAVLASIDIPAIGETTSGIIEFGVFGPNAGALSQGRAYARVQMSDGRVIHNNITNSLSALRSDDGQELLGRLYVTPTNVEINSPTLYEVTSFVTT